jgi:hypothetical protein
MRAPIGSGTPHVPAWLEALRGVSTLGDARGTVADDVRPPRLARHHTGVTDALLWRFIGIVDPSLTSQEPHMLRTYLVSHETHVHAPADTASASAGPAFVFSPNATTFSPASPLPPAGAAGPAEPSLAVEPPLAAALGVDAAVSAPPVALFSTMSLHPPAVAAGPAEPPPTLLAVVPVPDAPVGVDAVGSEPVAAAAGDDRFSELDRDYPAGSSEGSDWLHGDYDYGDHHESGF